MFKKRPFFKKKLRVLINPNVEHRQQYFLIALNKTYRP